MRGLFFNYSTEAEEQLHEEDQYEKSESLKTWKERQEPDEEEKPELDIETVKREYRAYAMRQSVSPFEIDFNSFRNIRS